ncbi:uncharacterized protein C8R40DRAFT_1068356 [Lentinula edodes]|uniref:uncharacterized protein n=1 Tax=Lentinula edodes TaxID=5353 RepID=UPI001E8D7B5C|nr:uncharacterized protein C8R40DRAFT_1068356 [Lentinula edodes]KAH7876546.1 hypothetical protein C8R40DRAFT_1068356 [Lentinula edodes]
MESALDIALRIELYNFAQTNAPPTIEKNFSRAANACDHCKLRKTRCTRPNGGLTACERCSLCNLECITSKTKRSNSFVAINFEPSTPIHAVDEEAEVEDRTQQTPLLQSPEDRTNTFPSPTQLAERMMDPIAISHTISDVKHLDTASLSKSRRKVKALNNLPVLARVRKRRCTRRNGGSTPCENCLARFQECITSIPRRSNSKLVVRNLKTSTPIHAVDEEVEVEDCTQLTRFPQNPEDLNTISAPFQIPTFLSTARLPERTIPDTSDSLINADPVSYNYKGREHRSYTEYLDTSSAGWICL